MNQVRNHAKTSLVSFDLRTAPYDVHLTVPEKISPSYSQVRYLALDVPLQQTTSFLLSLPPPLSRLELFTIKIPIGSSSEIFHESPVTAFTSAINLHTLRLSSYPTIGTISAPIVSSFTLNLTHLHFGYASIPWWKLLPILLQCMKLVKFTLTIDSETSDDLAMRRSQTEILLPNLQSLGFFITEGGTLSSILPHQNHSSSSTDCPVKGHDSVGQVCAYQRETVMLVLYLTRRIETQADTESMMKWRALAFS
jgi:hypothetical protein